MVRHFLCAYIVAAAVLCVGLSSASADIFGTGANQFTIDFVTIAGATNPSSGYGIVDHDYRMGRFEITKDQWDKFKAELGVPVTGYPSNAYDGDPYWTGTNVPISDVSWDEAVQFVNWLNTSTGHQAAYKFTGTQGTGYYSLATWSSAEANNGTNLFRHKDAMYFLPTEDEWVKAAYWNGTNLQTWATTDDSQPIAGIDSNYGQVAPYDGVWNVGSGSEELNGTYDMMGNILEWAESPYYSGDYYTNSYRNLRSGSFGSPVLGLSSSSRNRSEPSREDGLIGFRVASKVPEPGTMLMLAVASVGILRRK